MPQSYGKENTAMLKKILNYLREGLILTGAYMNYMNR